MMQRFNLDLTKESNINPVVYGRLGDKDFQKIQVYLSDNYEEVDLEGCLIQFEAITSVDTKVIDSSGVEISAEEKGRFIYTFPSQVFSSIGKYKRAYFSIVKEDRRGTTSDIDIFIYNNADLTAKEAETVISEYDKLVSELNDAYEAAIESVKEQGAAFNDYVEEVERKIKELEKFVNDNIAILEYVIDDIQGKIDSLDIYTKKETNQAIFKAVIGDKIDISGVCDFKDKIAGNEEIPHIAMMVGHPVIQSPNSSALYELNQSRYNGIKNLDDTNYSVTNVGNNNILQLNPKWNLIKQIEKDYPDVFPSFNADTSEKKISIIRKYMSLKSNVWGYGSGPSSNILYMRYWDGSVYTGVAQVSGTTTQKMAEEIPIEAVQADGTVNIVLYAPASNGVTPSALTIDYVNLEYTLSISATDIYYLKTEVYSKEEIDNLLNLKADKTNSYSKTEIDSKLIVKADTTQVETIETKIDSITAESIGAVSTAELMDLIYPVGTVYKSVIATNPADFFGGTWESISGKFLVGVDDNDSDFNLVEKTGGTKKLVTHRHAVSSNPTTTNATSGTGVVSSNSFTGQIDGDYTQLPPYLTVYFWKRIA